MTYAVVEYTPINGVATFTQNYGNVSWDGQSIWVCSSGKTTGGTLKINRYFTDGYSSTGKKQVVVHELGHLLGLAHAGTATCSGQPIMYYSSDRYFKCGHQNPQTDDINGANHLY